MDSSIPDGSFLGIECGATHSVALLAPGGGLPALRAEYGPANLRLLDDEALIEHFCAMKGLQDSSSLPLAGIAIGMAGARTDFDRQRIRNAAAKIWPGVPSYGTNDLETALVAGESEGGKSAARVLVLSGTGSCCFARRADGKTLRFGGWGHILGDKGSGYEIGLRGLKASVHFLDKEGKWPLLGKNILQTLQMNEPEELIDWAKTAAKSEVAALAIQVFASAAKGDKTARDILTAAASSLANDGAHCAQRVVKNKAPVEFILAGSVLVKQPGFAKQVRANLMALWPNATVTTLQRDSVCGALQLAMEHFSPGHAAAIPSKIENVSRPETDKTFVPASRALSPTEQRNPRSKKLDRLPLEKAVSLMIEEESKVGRALLKEKRKIVRAIHMVVETFRRGGRLFYVGAGTSGRLGVLDAVECPPTFRIPPHRVQGILAGGPSAIFKSVEGAEDSTSGGASAIDYRGVNQRDVVIGIAASGRTPFVWGALAEAKRKGAKTALICFNPHLQIPASARPDLVIAVDVGPEVLTGSTRLKAGTATKVILNTLTTLAMVRMGKVISNLMVDLNASNRKLRERAVRIVQAVTGADAVAAHAALEKSKWIVKAACQRLR
jgi:N-acetylmuramic acid 6-phosphate etherase